MISISYISVVVTHYLLVERVSVRGVADTETVDCERTVTSSQGYIDVAIVVVVVLEIPVCLVEADTVGQNLDCAAVATVWLTVLRRDVVGSL